MKTPMTSLIANIEQAEGKDDSNIDDGKFFLQILI